MRKMSELLQMCTAFHQYWTEELSDAEHMCAAAGYCHGAGEISTDEWSYVTQFCARMVNQLRLMWYPINVVGQADLVDIPTVQFQLLSIAKKRNKLMIDVDAEYVKNWYNDVIVALEKAEDDPHFDPIRDDLQVEVFGKRMVFRCYLLGPTEMKEPVSSEEVKPQWQFRMNKM